MFKSVGKIVYNPKTHIGINDQWAILSCDDNIAAYYRTLYHREFPWKPKLMRPVWGSHISFLRSETIKKSHYGLDKNKIIEFEYEPGVLDNGNYFWLKVSCPYLNELRCRYGLSANPKYGLHLTIGISSAKI